MKFDAVRVGEQFGFILDGKCGTYLKLSETDAVEVENPGKRERITRIGSVVRIEVTAPVVDCMLCGSPLLGGGYGAPWGFFVRPLRDYEVAASVRAGRRPRPYFAYHRACAMIDHGYGPKDVPRPDQADRDGRGERGETPPNWPRAPETNKPECVRKKRSGYRKAG